MKRKWMLRYLLGGLLLGPGVGVSRAGPITWEFSGEIFNVIDDNNLLGGNVVVGTPFSGSFTFDSTVMDSDPEPLLGLYEDVVLDIRGQVGGMAFFGPVGENSITVVNSDLDRYLLEAGVEFLGEQLDFLLIAPSSGDLFANTALPLVPPDFESVGPPLRFIIADTSEALPFSIQGFVNVLVPEPGTAILIACALTLAFVRRR